MLHRPYQTPQDILTALDSFLGNTQGQIIYRDSDRWKALATGTSGRFLLTKGASDNPIWQPSLWRAMFGSVTGAAATTFTMSFSPFTLSTASGILVRGVWKNATGSSANVSLYYDADTTAGNYDKETLLGTGATPVSANSNNAIVFNIPASSETIGLGYIDLDVSGVPRSVWLFCEGATTGMVIRAVAHKWRTVTTPASLTWSSSVASSLDIGSRSGGFTMGGA